MEIRISAVVAATTTVEHFVMQNKRMTQFSLSLSYTKTHTFRAIEFEKERIKNQQQQQKQTKPIEKVGV